MIEFANEIARTEFHLMPLEEQKRWHEIAEAYFSMGSVIKIICVERWSEKESDISIRIDKKFNPV